MAKVVFKNNNINDIFNGNAELSVAGNGSKATYSDGITAGRLVFVGSNLAADGDNLAGGRIRQLLITDENDDFAFKLTKADFRAKDLPQDFTTGDLTGLLGAMLDGKDRIVGSTDGDFLYGYGGADRITGKIGDDFITGGRGNDILTGGAGTDTFHFVPAEDGRSHDVITDMDITGPVIDHLFIEPVVINSIDAVHNGRDTLLTLDGQSTVLLENVVRADLLEYFTEL